MFRFMQVKIAYFCKQRRGNPAGLRLEGIPCQLTEISKLWTRVAVFKIGPVWPYLRSRVLHKFSKNNWFDPSK